MQKPSDEFPSPLADAVEPVAAPEPEQDPAGGITLSGRNRASARARVLSGMLLTSGLVAAIGTLDTSSSVLPGIYH
jgi:hypothetical protein